MTLLMNELGEFVTPEEERPNPYAEAWKGRAKPRIAEEPRGPRPMSVCAVCGAEFELRVHNQRYCSDACRAEARKTKEKARRTAIAATLALSLLWSVPAFADEALEVSDLPSEHVGGSVAHGFAASVPQEAPEEPQDADGGAAAPEALRAPETEPAPAAGGYAGYVAEYSELYNDDGPSHEMPGWHDGYLETYYNASAHYLASEWTLDSEGFYHDAQGRYVVGVDIAEGIELGTVVDTGKGEAVVLDYGSGAKVHDFATAW